MITASALRAHCAYPAVLKRDKRPTPDQQAAMDRGTAFHMAVEQWLKTGEIPVVADMECQGWIDLLAAEWNPPPRGAMTEIAWGLRPDGKYADVLEPEPHVYVARDGGELLTAGRADVAWLHGGVLTVVDLKTGRWPVAPAGENLQVNAAGIALAQVSFTRGYVPAIYYARDGAWDMGERVELDSPEWAQMFEAVRAAALLPPEPRPGEHCAGCWERKRCPASEPSHG